MTLAASALAFVSAGPAQAADPVEVNILGINDFHGRINASGTQAGAAVLAGAVDEIRGAHPNTVFAAAGDLIGASTFESFIQKDKPTIDALNAAGLDVSAVGNHEFDQGYDDLVNRVMAPFDPDTNKFGGAEWKYLGANVKMKESGDPALDPTFVKTFGAGDSEVQVGFVGAVTEHLDELVSPAGIAELDILDIPTAVNTEADALKADGVDLVVLLVHEGAPGTDCDAMDDDPTSDFGEIVTGVNANVDAIISGHTHLAYDCKFPVAEWADRAVTERPVVSAGQYGMNLNQLTFQVDPDTGLPTALETALLPLVKEPAYPADEDVAALVAAANAEADVLGAEPLGTIAGPFNRARLGNGTTENRGGESTLGNLVAEAQRAAADTQIAFMNPGGLRADMIGLAENGYPATLTFKQAAEVQPFANTLVKMSLTGTQIKSLLEEQWQPEGASRPFLRLGTSDGFEFSYDPTAAAGEHITGIWLNGEPLDGATSYSVTANSFLAAGGDNFGTFAEGADPTDTGQIDLNAMVDYMAQFDEENPLAVDASQHSIGATTVGNVLVLTSLAMTGVDDVKDESVDVSEGDTSYGSFDVDNTVADQPFDDYGVALVPLSALPRDGKLHVLTVTGATTGTEIQVPVVISKAAPKIGVKVKPKKVKAKKTRAKVIVKVKADGQAAKGRVQVKIAGKTFKAKLNGNGRAVVKLPKFAKTGKKTVRVKYLGNKTTKKGSAKATFRVVK